MNGYVEFGILFGAVFLVAFVIIQWSILRRQRLEERLRREGKDGDSNPELVLGELTPAFAGQLPLRGEKREEMRVELLEAGYYRPSAPMEYAAIRALLVLVPLVATGVLAALADPPYTGRILAVGMVLAVLGFVVPRVYVNMRARRRKRVIERGLPVAVDLLALGLLSGQNILIGLRRVSKEMSHSFPVLARELEIVREQAELTTLPYALERWATRVRIPEVNNLVIILTQSSRYGSDVATGLLEFADNFRVNLRQNADAAASRAGFWMIFPTIFCLWIPAFMLLVAPILFEFTERGREAQEAIQRSREGTRILEQNRQDAQGVLNPVPPR